MRTAVASAEPNALARAELDRFAPQALRWNSEFDAANALSGAEAQAPGGKGITRSFGLSTVGPDFGEPEAGDQQFDLGNSLTLEPRAVVSRRVGQEFEQTYANGASTSSDALLDGAVTAVGRVGTVRLRL